MRYLFLCIAIFVAGCSKEPIVLPDVPTLNLTEQQLSSLHGLTADVETVWQSDNLVLTGTSADITYRLWSPGKPGHYPLLVFSHGNWSSQTKYDELLRLWVANGYVVVTLDHDDCCGMASGIFAALRHGNMYLLQQRVRDIVNLLDNEQQWVGQLPEGVTAATDNIAITGHSFGAFTAQMFAGAQVYDPDEEQMVDAALDGFDLGRVRAVLSISPPGPMFDEITKDSWLNLNKAMMVTTGTWDVEPNFFPEYQLHQMSYDTAPEGEKYSLLIQGADHYFGNLICRPEREEAPQQVQFDLLVSATTTFLDGYLKGDDQAIEQLKSNQLGAMTAGFASIAHK